MKYKDEIIRFVSHKACKNISDSVIKNLFEDTESVTSGDDDGLGNVWNEVCVQMQDEQWINWDWYEEHILNLIEKVVQNLDTVLTGAIWLQTREGEDWDDLNEAAEEGNIIGQIDTTDYDEFYFLEIESIKPRVHFVKIQYRTPSIMI